MTQDFKQLDVWKKAHQLTLDVYKATVNFPQAELYGLTSQTRRSAASIPANIAEGCGRGTNPELSRFLYIARGSASELEYHLHLAHDLGFLDTTGFAHLNDGVDEVKRMLAGLIKRVEDSR